MFSTQIDDSGARWHARPARAAQRQGRAPALHARLASDKSAGMDHQASSARGREPVDAALQVVDRFLMDVLGSVEPRSTRRARMVCPPQQPWALWIEKPRSAHSLRTSARIGEAAPLGKDLQDAGTEARRPVELASRSMSRIAVGHHGAEGSSGHDACALDRSFRHVASVHKGDETSCRSRRWKSS